MALLERSKLPKSALIVKFLPEGTTSDDLHFLFAPFGEITRVNIAQDFQDGGLNGFVDFASREDAELAMDELDGMETTEGRKLRIDWTKDSASWDPACTIRVTFLPPEVSRKLLKENFGRFVTLVQVAYVWEIGEPLEPGHAFVAFASPEQAKMAMAKFGGRVTKATEELTVDWQKNIAGGHNSRAPMIIVIFLPTDIADDSVRAMFELHGEILSLDVTEDRHTGVTVRKIRYMRTDNAEYAIDAMDGRLIGGNAIRVLWAHKSRPKGFDVKIELLPDHVDRKMLKQRLECYGKIRRAEVQYDWKTGDSLKHAYVTFAKEEEAEAATSAFCGRRRRQGIWVVDWCTSFVLVVIGLPEQAAEGALREVFSEIGEITTIQSVHDHRTGSFMRHAFVSYARLRDAERAVEELDGMDLGSGPIRILWKDTSFPNGYDLQVRNLDAEADRKVLKEMFQRFGEVM